MAGSTPLQRRPLRLRIRIPDARTALYFSLHFIGFLASTLLMSWGLFLLAFLALGGFSLDGLMHQLNNVARRYVEAGPERIEQFRDSVAAVHFAVSVLLIILRRHRIIPELLDEESSDHG